LAVSVGWSGVGGGVCEAALMGVDAFWQPNYATDHTFLQLSSDSIGIIS